MEINLAGIGKKFRKEWIFRHIDLTFSSARYALIGHNGSGKSTLLQVISNLILATEGTVSYSKEGKKILDEDIPFQLSFSAPYQELVEEFTGLEVVDFHFKFRRQLLVGNSVAFLESIGLGANAHKQIKYFSSGMKQRLKLALCAFTEADAYFFDEPTTNLDKNGSGWYEQLITQLPSSKIVIISSNTESEYHMCENVIHLADYKRMAL